MFYKRLILVPGTRTQGNYLIASRCYEIARAHYPPDYPLQGLRLDGLFAEIVG